MSFYRYKISELLDQIKNSKKVVMKWKCRQIMCKYNIKNRKQFLKWAQKHHPDKRPNFATEFTKATDCYGEKIYCQTIPLRPTTIEAMITKYEKILKVLEDELDRIYNEYHQNKDNISQKSKSKPKKQRKKQRKKQSKKQPKKPTTTMVFDGIIGNMFEQATKKGKSAKTLPSGCKSTCTYNILKQGNKENIKKACRVVDLRKWLTKRNLPKTGNKNELVDRLISDFKRNKKTGKKINCNKTNIKKMSVLELRNVCTKDELIKICKQLIN